MSQDTESRIERMEDRFDKFQEMYIANGKELARLAEGVENLTEAVGNQHEAFEEYKKSNAKSLEWVRNMKWGQQTLVALVSFFATVIGIIIAVKTNFLR